MVRKEWIDTGKMIVFLITSNGVTIGHIGLYRFDYRAHSCELDNVLRERWPDRCYDVCNAGIDGWARKNFRLKKMTLRVFEDNNKAVSLYE